MGHARARTARLWVWARERAVQVRVSYCARSALENRRGLARLKFPYFIKHPAALRSAGLPGSAWGDAPAFGPLRPRCADARPYGWDRPKGMSRALTGRRLHPSPTCLRRGPQAPGWRGRRTRVPAHGWLGARNSHPVRHRPRTSRADTAPGVQVVRTVARSTWTPGTASAPHACGPTADGMGVEVGRGLLHAFKGAASVRQVHQALIVG